MPLCCYIHVVHYSHYLSPVHRRYRRYGMRRPRAAPEPRDAGARQSGSGARESCAPQKLQNATCLRSQKRWHSAQALHYRRRWEDRSGTSRSACARCELDLLRLNSRDYKSLEPGLWLQGTVTHVYLSLISVVEALKLLCRLTLQPCLKSH